MRFHTLLRSSAALCIAAWMSLQPVPASEGAAEPLGPTATAGRAFEDGAAPASDCNDNGVEDAVDIAVGYSSDVDGNGVPDECDVDGR